MINDQFHYRSTIRCVSNNNRLTKISWTMKSNYFEFEYYFITNSDLFYSKFGQLILFGFQG